MQNNNLFERMLLDRCRWNQPNLVIDFLKNNVNVDVSWDDGVCFQVANSSIKILDALLKHVNEQKVIPILDEIMKNQDVCFEMQERIKKFLTSSK